MRPTHQRRGMPERRSGWQHLFRPWNPDWSPASKGWPKSWGSPARILINLFPKECTAAHKWPTMAWRLVAKAA